MYTLNKNDLEMTCGQYAKLVVI